MFTFRFLWHIFGNIFKHFIKVLSFSEMLFDRPCLKVVSSCSVHSDVQFASTRLAAPSPHILSWWCHMEPELVQWQSGVELQHPVFAQEAGLCCQSSLAPPSHQNLFHSGSKGSSRCWQNSRLKARVYKASDDITDAPFMTHPSVSNVSIHDLTRPLVSTWPFTLHFKENLLIFWQFITSADDTDPF